MKIKWPPVVLLILSIVSGIYYYPRLPERMASHWNSLGQVDGYMSKFWGTFLLPLILLVIYVLMVLVPRIDPKRANIQKFSKVYENFITLMMLFFAYLYGLTLYWNLGSVFNFNVFILPAFAVLFFYVGYMVERAEQNWTIGIRTPWTLSNLDVWKKTHRFGGFLFKLSAVISLVGLIWPQIAFWFVIVPVIATTILVYVYSYLIFKRESK